MDAFTQGIHKRTRLRIRALLWFIIAAASACWALIVVFSIGILPTRGSDFGVYFDSAEALRFDSHANIYAWQTLASVTQAHGGCVAFAQTPFTYPPLLAILMEPLTLLSCAPATYVWHSLNALMWAGSIVLLTAQLRKRWPTHRLLATALILCASVFFWHLLWGFWLGQVHILVLFGILLVPWLDEHHHPMLAGAVLAFIALIKLFPLLLILYYLVRGRWRIVIGAALAGVALTFVMVMAVGSAEVFRSVPAMAGTVHLLSSISLNESLSKMIPIVGPLLADVVGVVGVCGIWLLRRDGDEHLGYAWMLCTMLLISPLVWSFYLIWLLPVFVACLGEIQPRQWRAVAALLLLFVTIASQTPMVFRPIATLVLWMVTGALFLRSARPSHARWLPALAQRFVSARTRLMPAAPHP